MQMKSAALFVKKLNDLVSYNSNLFHSVKVSKNWGYSYIIINFNKTHVEDIVSPKMVKQLAKETGLLLEKDFYENEWFMEGAQIRIIFKDF